MNNIDSTVNLLDRIEYWWEKSQKNSVESSVHERQKQSFEFFRQNGFPHKKIEDWKYTNVRKITKLPYAWPVKKEVELDQRNFEKFPLTHDVDAYKLVFVNGYLNDSLSVLPTGENAFTVTHLENVEAEGAYQENLASVVTNESGFTALNTAMHSGGVLIDIPKGVVVDKPVFVYYISVTDEDLYLIQPRNLIIVEDNSQVKLVEVFVGKGAHPSLTNIVSEIKVGSGAHVDYSKLQLEEGDRYHVGYTKVYQEKDSKVETHQISLNGAFVRNDLHFYQDGKNCNSILNGLFILNDHQFLDNHTRVDHAKSQCFSDELYKGILDDQSTGVFNGKVVVHQDAQKINSYQQNSNTLLNDGATINTKPELEIYADDVRCTHGATTGHLDAEAIFYLRSRGLSKHEAQHFLLKSYAYEVVEKMNVEGLIDPLKNLIDYKLRSID
ncbi:MAG TPA: Fe-S cluster assembly protein SufD [Chitinophagaceae bacterium]|nr:Fe-S cluster assembly protein SufD [Chitinophagaceae bacterium]